MQGPFPDLNWSHARSISCSRTGHMQGPFPDLNRSHARSISCSRTGHMQGPFPDPEQVTCKVTCKVHFLILNRSHARSISCSRTLRSHARSISWSWTGHMHSWPRTGHVQGPFADPEQVKCKIYFLIPNKSPASVISWSWTSQISCSGTDHMQGPFPDA